MFQDFFNAKKRHSSCKTCDVIMDKNKIITMLPRVTYMALSGKKLEFDIDREIVVNNEQYKLVVVVYSGSGHFMCRMIFDNQVVEYDGLANDGKFRAVEQHNSLHGEIIDLSDRKRQACQIFYKKCDD